jgi:hypothetical protein
MGLGERDQAFEWLGKSCQMRVPQLTLINVDPAYDILTGDARFGEIVRRVGLAPRAGL